MRSVFPRSPAAVIRPRRRPSRPAEEARVERLLPAARDAVGRRAGAARDDLRELRADVVQAHAVVGGDPLREAALDQLAVARPAELLAVVVRARAPRQPTEAVHPLELRA